MVKNSAFILEILWTKKSLDLGFKFRINIDIKDYGKTIISFKVSKSQPKATIKENLKKIKGMAKGNFFGKIDNSILENGIMAIKMDLECGNLVEATIT